MNKVKINWGYIAGFLDGDGWITSSKNKNARTKRYLIGFTQSKERYKYMNIILKFIKSHGIKATLIERVSNSQIKTDVPMLNIQIKEQESVVKFMNNVKPFLLIKEDKGKECLEYTKLRLIKRGKFLSNYKQKKRKYWNKKEIKNLIKLQKEGYSNKTIGNTLKRSSDSIGNKLHRMNEVRTQKEFRR